MGKRTCWPGLVFRCSLLFLAAVSAYAQDEPVGIVTAVQGQVELTRATTQTPLRFKDGLLIRDTVDTQEKSLVPILFGGKSSVTVREHSRLRGH